MIGFGSIGKGTLPLIERHFSYDKKRFIVIDPEGQDLQTAGSSAASASSIGSDQDNYRHLLDAAAHAGGGPGFLRERIGDTSSLDIMELCREIGAPYRHRGRALEGLLF
jgi:homospermidine synthase